MGIRQVDSRDSGFEGDSDDRLSHATSPAVVETGIDPQDVIADWGDYERDHTDQGHDSANAIPATQDEEGTRYATRSEVEDYYDQLRPEDIQIRDL